MQWIAFTFFFFAGALTASTMISILWLSEMEVKYGVIPVREKAQWITIDKDE